MTSPGLPAYPMSRGDRELWFNRDFALWRSIWSLGAWQEPVRMIGPLAGEATLDGKPAVLVF